MAYVPATLCPRASNWLRAAAPRILTRVPHATIRALSAALRAVDRDIELYGSVTYETVEQVRATRTLLRSF